jgi:hypothetical protein
MTKSLTHCCRNYDKTNRPDLRKTRNDSIILARYHSGYIGVDRRVISVLGGTLVTTAWRVLRYPSGYGG